jgi:hypothetical protein
MKTFGTLTLPSNKLVLCDPCYIDQKMINELASGNTSECDSADFLVLDVPGNATVCHETADEGFRMKRVALFFTDVFDLEGHDYEEIAALGVDSGQMGYYDASHLAAEWRDEEYNSKRSYRNKEDLRVLTYLVHFPHYEAPIASEGGKTMNELNATGEWEELPYSGDIKVSYNGMCHCHDDGPYDIGKVDDSIVISGTGYGDGCYNVSVYHDKTGRLACVTIDFLYDEEEEDEFDYEEDEDEELED